MEPNRLVFVNALPLPTPTLTYLYLYLVCVVYVFVVFVRVGVGVGGQSCWHPVRLGSPDPYAEHAIKRATRSDFLPPSGFA